MKTRNASLQIAVSAAFCASVAILPIAAVGAETYAISDSSGGVVSNVV